MASLTHTHIGRDFNGTTSNLGGYTKSLEERGLSWFHTSVTCWDVHIGGRDGTSTGWGSDPVGQDFLAGLLEVAVGEDEADVALDVWEEALVLGEIGLEGPQGAANLLIVDR